MSVSGHVRSRYRYNTMIAMRYCVVYRQSQFTSDIGLSDVSIHNVAWSLCNNRESGARSSKLPKFFLRFSYDLRKFGDLRKNFLRTS